MAAPKITEARALILRSLAGEIDAVAHSPRHLKALAERYRTEQRLSLTCSGGTNIARMRGVAASSTESDEAALAGWARAARRALLNAGMS